jgi:hypothetical protein
LEVEHQLAPSGDLMKLKCLVQIAIATSVTAFAQPSTDQELARLLAAENTRHLAIDEIVKAGTQKTALLLSWTRNPPPGIDQQELNVGLADAFGKMRTEEAIPFLIQNINLLRVPGFVNFWKSAQMIEQFLPAVGALVQIGPEASREVMRNAWEMRIQDFHVAVFVVSQVKDVAESKAFLSAVRSYANAESYWASEGK